VHEIVILSAKRTPIGAFLGALREVPAPHLGAAALRGAIAAAGLEAARVEQVNMGCVLTAGVGQAPARQAALGAGCPQSTTAVTVGKVCGSGMRAVMMAANDLRCGDAEIAAAGGMENMSLAPYLLPGARAGMRLGHAQAVDSTIHDGLWDAYGAVHMGGCAELCADTLGFDREEQDAFARESYVRAREAIEKGAFENEMVTVEVPGRSGELTRVDQDEEPLRVDLAKMPRLKPAFREGGSVTAGNASSLSDGAAALLLTTAERAGREGWRPMARIVAHAAVAQQPEWFTTAPIAAIGAVLSRANLDVADIDLFEINEAFAVVVLAAQRELGLDPERVNVHGGAVALGHPIGASGARILVTLLHALERRSARRGLAAICIGGGEATAVVVERLG
jgi:acetyl-CoA C-acetyltransferase